jgi:hypothetical protein
VTVEQGEGTAEMPEHLVGLEIEPIEVPTRVLIERDDLVTMMVVSHREAESRPEPLRGVRLGIVWRGVDEPKLVPVLLEGLSEKLRALGGVDAEVVEDDHRRATASLGALDQMIELEAEDVGRAMQTIADREEAVSPVEGAEADEASARAWRTDEPLTAAAFPTPDLMKRRVQPNVDLILDVEVGGGEQLEKLIDVGGDLRPEVGLDEGVPVEVSKGSGLR